MEATEKLELAEGQPFKDFSDGVFAQIPAGAIFAYFPESINKYVYDPYFKMDTEEWCVRQPSPGSWLIIKVEKQN